VFWALRASWCGAGSGTGVMAAGARVSFPRRRESIKSFALLRGLAWCLLRAPLRGRGAACFLCLANESKLRKACPRRRPLPGCPVLLARAGGHRHSHDRACGAPRASDSRCPKAPTRAALLGVFEGINGKGSAHCPTLSQSAERELSPGRRPLPEVPRKAAQPRQLAIEAHLVRGRRSSTQPTSHVNFLRLRGES